MDGGFKHPVHESRLVENFQRPRLQGRRSGLPVRMAFTLDDARVHSVAR